MILVDLNQVMISNLMIQIGNHQNAEIDENTLRHMVLNSLRSYRSKFFKEYGELVICADDKDYWRKHLFQYYKASRKKMRDNSEMDWNMIFQSLNKIRQELKDTFPYKVLHVPHAEADDIIATISHLEGKQLVADDAEKILILSGDKDYSQLHIYTNIDQYDPTRKKWIRCSDPELFLQEHIIRGDSGDGIPNILSPDSTFVMGLRQKVITAKRMERLKDINTYDEETRRNYFRNKSLIDLSLVPSNIKDEILDQYYTQKPNNRSKLFNYFIEHRLKHLMEYLSDF